MCSLPTRPGFEAVEEGAKRSADTEAQAVYEYSTHQGLELEEIEEEAEVRLSPQMRPQRIRKTQCAACIALRSFVWCSTA